MISVTQNKVNLCSSCKHGYPSCPAKVADVLYGDGTGCDNICCCAYYKPKCDTEESYQRGLSEGNDIGYKDGVKDGQNEAWECAKKLFSTMSETEIEKVFPTEWENGFYGLMQMKPQYAIDKLKAYEKKENEEIKVGDIIANNTEPKLKVWVTCFDEIGFCGIAITGFCTVDEGKLYASCSPKGWHKIGHFDINKILEGGAL